VNWLFLFGCAAYNLMRIQGCWKSTPEPPNAGLELAAWRKIAMAHRTVASHIQPS